MDESGFDRDSVMKQGLLLKFRQNEKLKEALIGTNDAVLEERGRFKGEYWTNKGLNRLGELLMEVREDLKKDEE